jgi:hypothetical protein
MPLRIAAFEDDVEAVPDEAILYRRIVWNKIGGRERCAVGATASLNDNCFTDWPADKALEEGFPGPCMSVGVSTVLASLGYTPDKMVENYPECGLACMSAGDLRNLTKMDKSQSPCPQGMMLAATDAEPWHGVVFDLAGGQRGAAARKAILRVARWVIPLVNDEG